MSKNKTTYNSGVNILGSVPDYSLMLDFISDTYGHTANSAGAFEFRTEKSLKRFIAAIETCILQFQSENHKQMFFEAIANTEFAIREKMIILFWQLTYSNNLFSKITREVYMKNVYSGRVSITAEEVLAYLRSLMASEANELQLSEETLKISASKYLTILKKLGLVEGAIKKTITYPVITSSVFVYFIRYALTVNPQDKTLQNPYMFFAFCEEQSIINRLKKIEYIKYWDISQVGNNLTIDLK